MPPTPPPPQILTNDVNVAKAGRWGSSTEISRRVVIVIVVLFVTGLLALSDTVHRQIVAGVLLQEARKCQACQTPNPPSRKSIPNSTSRLLASS